MNETSSNETVGTERATPIEHSHSSGSMSTTYYLAVVGTILMVAIAMGIAKLYRRYQLKKEAKMLHRKTIKLRLEQMQYSDYNDYQVEFYSKIDMDESVSAASQNDVNIADATSPYPSREGSNDNIVQNFLQPRKGSTMTDGSDNNNVENCPPKHGKVMDDCYPDK